MSPAAPRNTSRPSATPVRSVKTAWACIAGAAPSALGGFAAWPRFPRAGPVPPRLNVHDAGRSLQQKHRMQRQTRRPRSLSSFGLCLSGDPARVERQVYNSTIWAAKLEPSSVSFVPATPFHQGRPKTNFGRFCSFSKTRSKTRVSWMGFPLDASPLNFD